MKRFILRFLRKRPITEKGHRYTIGGRHYTHRPLVLAQWEQLIELLKGTNIPLRSGVMGMITALGDKLPQALAVCLTEEGKSPKDKDVEALAQEIRYALTAEMAMEIIDDFFALNPLPLILEKLAGTIQILGGMISANSIGSRRSASSSPEET